MTLLPGWDSSEFVREAHRDLEFSSIIGFLACAGGELLKHLKPSHEKLFERLAVAFFLIAVFMELIAFPYGERNDELAREQANKQDFAISMLSNKAQEALGKAKKAAEDSDSAISKAAEAITKSQSAGMASGAALTLARGAREEADTFEKDIKSAKAQSGEAKTLASDAKALLSDVRTLAAQAQQRASEATAGVARISTPRSLINVPELASALEPFKDTEYAFSSVFQDSESIDLLKAIDSLLQQAGWKKVKGPGGFPAVNVYGKEDGFAVPIGFNVGVQASVDSSESLTALQSLSVEKLPPPVGAAAVLTIRLGLQILPQSTDNVKPVDVHSGTSKTVRIAVGKKP
jgi:hypothetical protein